MVTENGKPAVEFDGSDDSLTAAQSLGITTTHAAIFVTYTVDASATGTFFSLSKEALQAFEVNKAAQQTIGLKYKTLHGNVTLQTSTQQAKSKISFLGA